MSPVLLGVLGYLVAQFAVGLAVSRKIANQTDYYAAGRRLGPLLAGASMFATWFGAESCVGAAGHVYEHGIDRRTVEPFAYGLCLILLGLFFAIPFWRAGSITLADLFRRRYSGTVERVAALLLIPTSVLWAAAQVRAFGQVLSAASEIEVESATTAAAVIVVAYTAAGGLMADVVTDLVQAVALLVGLLVLVAGVCADLGTAGAALEAAAATRPPRPEPGFLATIEAWAIPLCGSVVAQEAVARCVASRSPRVARTSALAGGAAYLLVGSIPVFLGLVGPSIVPHLEDPEQILPALAQRHLGTLGFVVFAGALISAILSTVDSTLLVASSLATRNLLFAGGEPSDPKIGLRAARGGVVLFGILAWALARGADGIGELVEQASGFASGSILVLVTFGLFTRFGGALAALACLAAGAGVWIWGRYLAEGLDHPYLLSLGSGLGAFLVVGALERAAGRAPAPLPTEEQ